MATRRNFVKQSLLASTALAAGSLSAFANEQTKNKPMANSINQDKAKVAVITWTYGINDLNELFSKIKETGFDAVQFCSDVNQYKASDVVHYAGQYGIKILGYDPGASNPPSGVQPTIENAVAYFTKTIEFAKAIGSPMSCLQGLSNWTKGIKAYEDAMQFMIKVIRRLDKVAEQHQITLTFEACCHYEIPWVQTADELLRIHKETEAKNLLLVLDSFHMNIGETDMLEPIRKIGKLLHSYHVSDSGRGGIGTGHIDYVAQYKTMKEAGFDGYVFFEFVIPECRPYKLPMNERQMEEFIAQNKYSLKMWNAIAGA